MGAINYRNVAKMRQYYFYEKSYNELFVFYRYKNNYVYQKYFDFINCDPWRFSIYPCYKITSFKQLKKEIKAINKKYELKYKQITNIKLLEKIKRGLEK